ncbi:MCE family protein [Actinomadura sp. DC4]|uniref:MCE family protein n=1 Tax=Actinomadura sp. DC4 TaxID=3055069 RepID=UPI0025B09AC7|nr:MCE family protein [Actinomadura sp. DC4]MDN3357844.1 MCE family protein [Actinomadura sp. DC4]
MKPIRERSPVAVAVVGLVILLGLGSAAYAADDLPVIGGGTTYNADFTESAGLHSGNEVRVAGVKVGKVTGVSLDRGRVKVSFRVKDTWVGDASRASIMIKTLLGEKYLAVDPLGTAAQNPSRRIPVSRTTSPYDVTQAFNQLGTTFGELDTDKLGQSLQTIADTFRDTAPNVRSAVQGLSALSKTISSRDARLARLLAGTRKITATLAGQNENFESLLRDGNLLLGEIGRRRYAIHELLTGTQQLSTQLSGLVKDNQAQLDPTLRALDQVTGMLRRNQGSLDHALAVAGPYYRLIGNTLGNGRWFDSYLCGVIPKDYLPPGTPPATGCMPPKQEDGR